jgi:hypothetical protein
MRLSQFLKACGTSVSILQLAFATPTSLRPQRASALPKAALAFALGCRSCFAFALQERLASAGRHRSAEGRSCFLAARSAERSDRV